MGYDYVGKKRMGQVESVKILSTTFLRKEWNIELARIRRIARDPP